MDVDDQIYPSELADLLEDEERQRAIDEVPNDPVGDPEEEDSTDDEDANIGNNCMSDQGSVEVDEVPELTSDEEGRPIHSSRELERYDSSTGHFYAQMEACHTIVKHSNEPKVTLGYTGEEMQVVASIITQLKAK